VRLARLLWQLVRNPRHEVYYGAGPMLMSALRKRWVIFMNPHATIEFGPDVHVGPGFSLHVRGGGTFRVGARTEIRRGFRAEIYDGATLTIGEDCVMSYDVLIACSSSVEIGNHVGLGQATALYDGAHLWRDLTKPPMRQGFDLRPIKIGDYVSVYSKVTITSDIGERAAVGAHAFVNRPVPPYTLATGVPATPKESFGPPS